MYRLLVPLAVTTVALAQRPIIIGPAQVPCTTFWVDATFGLASNPGTSPQTALNTLTAAIPLAATAAAAGIITSIVMLPGVYSDAVETMPFQLPAGVQLQGTSALNTILLATTAPTVFDFTPTTYNQYGAGAWGSGTGSSTGR